MSVPNFLRVEAIQPISTIHSRENVVVQALERKTHIAIFIHSPVQMLQISLNQLIRIHQSPNVSQLIMQITVKDIGFGRLGMTMLDERPFD